MKAANISRADKSVKSAASKRLAFGTAISVACNAIKLVTQLLIVPVIARLLGPADYGVYALALPSIQLVLTLADGGLGQSLAREDENNETVWSSAFWLLLALGFLLAILVAAWSFPLSIMGHQPRLPMYMAPLSGTVLLLSLCVCPGARLTRRARVATTSLVDLFATITAAVAAITAAMLHTGVWSLVIQLLLVWGIRAAAFNLAAFKMPRLIFDWSTITEHSAVGGGIIATKLTESLGRMFEIALVSSRFGATGVGAYGFALQVAWSLTQSITSPIWMGLYVRMLHIRSAIEAEVLYHRMLRILVMISFPASVIIAVNAGILTDHLLGKSWIGGAFALALIIPSTALAACSQLSGAALYAKGVTRPQIFMALANAILRCSAVGLPVGDFREMITLLSISNLLFFGINIFNSKVSLGWSILGTLNSLRGPLVATVASGVEAYLVLSRCPQTLLTSLASGLMGSVVFIAVLCISDWSRLRSDLDVVLGMVRL